MRWWWWLLIVFGVISSLLAAVGLSIRRSRRALTEFARLVPPCLALLRDILRDKTVPRRAKVVPAVALAYLAFPIDLIPDFIPGAGQLDDALVVAWAVRHLFAAAGRDTIVAHWRGDPGALERVLRLARIR